MELDPRAASAQTAACNERVNMHITITSDGGFTGRGIGSVEIEDARASPALARAIAAAHPEEWEREYRVALGADFVTYTLTMGDVVTTWDEGAEIPEDLRAVFEVAWER